MALLQLPDPIFQKISLSLSRRGLGGNKLGLRIREIIYEDGRENLFKAANYMPFNYLRRNVRDECLLEDLGIYRISISESYP